MPLLAGLGPLGVPELLIIAFIIILIFGVGRIPEVGGALGKGIREFRNSTKDDADGESSATMASADDPTASGSAMSGESRFCSECGTRNERAAKFCAECGHTMSAAAV
jgi:sec-independent protein translocase protein TatA